MADDMFDRSEFISYFRDEAGELLERMDSDLLVLEETIDGGAVEPDLINAIFRSLHTIKGSAGMLEFTDIQKVAHRLETAIDLLRSNAITLDAELLALIFSGRDLLSAQIERAVNGDMRTLPQIESYLSSLETFIAAKTQSAGDAAPPLEQSVDSDAAQVAAFEAEVARLLREQSTQEPAPQATAAAAAKPVQAPAKQPINSTIRVDLERLDTLLNLVGELVINRTQIAGIAQNMQRALDRSGGEAAPLAKELVASASTLARISNELQESVMKARMVPVAQVFERFPRTVRDLAKSTGKEMTLVINGAETDLDKTIVDQIGEPLMHLVRNCADHGIESADVRARNGKPAMATISLNAYHEGNQVIIQIGDDGGGIDHEKIRARGIERGLIDSYTAYTESEILDLIFAPGFSTAQTVSAISGRGVGMDVVKRCVNDLKGVLELDTKLGVGTTFTIRLPLTLAIIRTLLVRVADRLYAIPLDVVLESQRIEAGDIRTISGSQVVTLREQIVPIVRLSEIFGLQASAEDDGYEVIVVVSHKGRRIALLVDGFEGEQEIVIKPLSKILGNTGCIAGATILGNGAVALILDIAAFSVAQPRMEYAAHYAEIG